MSKYTTGEIARLCGVTVRTVQYYDARNILVPSEMSEGGRRLYSDDDIKRLRIICFLREAGLPLSSIEALLTDEQPEKVIWVLLDQQEKALCEELAQGQKKLSMLEDIRRALKSVTSFSVESIGDIATRMAGKQKLKKLHLMLLLGGVPLLVWQLVSIAVWILTGTAWPFVLWVVIGVPCAVLISRSIFMHIAYICPECHTVFKPRFQDVLRANHTPTLRKLVCTCCGHRGWCVETYAEEEKKND